MHSFYHKFFKQGREQLYHLHVKMLSRLEDLTEIEAEYASLGLTDACGNMDVVHIALGACPTGLSNLMTDKEIYPSIGYNMICDHLSRALDLMLGAYGSINDQTIVKFDEAVEDVKTTNKLFKEDLYKMRNEQGERQLEKGVYIIVDGAYP